MIINRHVWHLNAVIARIYREKVKDIMQQVPACDRTRAAINTLRDIMRAASKTLTWQRADITDKKELVENMLVIAAVHGVPVYEVSIRNDILNDCN